MQSGIRTILRAVEITGSVGVPGAGTAAIILQDIVAVCNEIRIHKRKAQRISAKCSHLLIAFNENSLNLAGSELQARADEAINILEAVKRRVAEWARLNRLQLFFRSTEIADGLEMCETQINTAMQAFNVHGDAILYQEQIRARENLAEQHVEVLDLLQRILNNQQDMQDVVEMTRAGAPIAQQLMRTGQLELRRAREENLASDRQGSPSAMDLPRYLQVEERLMDLHRQTNIPPSIKILDGEIRRSGELAIAGGVYSDVWLGTWLGGRKVALKALRNIKSTDPIAKKRFQHEIEVWAQLDHPNILPFYGIATNLGQNIQMVSPWQENGNVLDYTKHHPGASKIYLLVGAASGLEYLHSRNIVHGNVRCTNILVSASGESCICDFGMSKIIEEVTEKSASATLTTSGSARWLAPELINGAISSPTKESDVYSFGMAILELLTGEKPFAHRKRDAAVIVDIVVHKQMPARPDKPEVSRWLNDRLWSLLRQCWRPEADSRPTMSYIAQSLRKCDFRPTTSTLAHSPDAMDTM